MEKPVLDKEFLEKVGANVGKKPAEIQEATVKIVAELSNDTSMLLGAVVLTMFRITAFASSNLMTPDKLAAVMVEPLCHRDSPPSIAGMNILIENAPKFFQPRKLETTSVDKARRRESHMAVMRLQEVVVLVARSYIHWGFQRWMDSGTKGVCEKILKNTIREQGKGRIGFHKAIRHVRSNLLARGFQRWALLLDLKPKAFIQQCQSKVETYSTQPNYSVFNQARNMLDQITKTVLQNSRDSIRLQHIKQQ